MKKRDIGIVPSVGMFEGIDMQVLYTDELLGSLARAYCHEENKNKTLDSDLLNSIMIEVSQFLLDKGYPVCVT